MDEQRPRRPADDDVPIIGDYSQTADARLRADEERRAAASPAAEPPPRQRDRGTSRQRESWALDPGDMRRHAQRMRQREQRGPLRKIAPYGFAALLLATAGAIYWNFDQLRGITLDFSQLTSLFRDRATPADRTAPVADVGTDTVAVEAPAIVGSDVAADENAASPEPAAAAPPQPATAAPAEPAADAPRDAPSEAPADDAAPAAPLATATAASNDEPDRSLASTPASTPAPPPPPAPPPEPPPGPESFSFGVPVVHVSEADAGAAVLILRNGDRRRSSSVTWWTKDGTAKAGEDYADLGKVVAKFAPGEQNRTIHVPIVSDHRVEGPESFYVYFATDEAAIAASQPTEQVEVVIDDQG